MNHAPAKQTIIKQTHCKFEGRFGQVTCRGSCTAKKPANIDGGVHDTCASS